MSQAPSFRSVAIATAIAAMFLSLPLMSVAMGADSAPHAQGTAPPPAAAPNVPSSPPSPNLNPSNPNTMPQSNEVPVSPGTSAGSSSTGTH
jgi:hypothetical protein